MKKQLLAFLTYLLSIYVKTYTISLYFFNYFIYFHFNFYTLFSLIFFFFFRFLPQLDSEILDFHFFFSFLKFEFWLHISSSHSNNISNVLL